MVTDKSTASAFPKSSPSIDPATGQPRAQDQSSGAEGAHSEGEPMTQSLFLDTVDREAVAEPEDVRKLREKAAKVMTPEAIDEITRRLWERLGGLRALCEQVTEPWDKDGLNLERPIADLFDLVQSDALDVFDLVDGAKDQVRKAERARSKLEGSKGEIPPRADDQPGRAARPLAVDDNLEDIAFDLRALITTAESMQDNLWGFSDMEGPPGARRWFFRDQAAVFNDGLTFALGEMSRRVRRLQALASEAEEALMAARKNKAVQPGPNDTAAHTPTPKPKEEGGAAPGADSGSDDDGRTVEDVYAHLRSYAATLQLFEENPGEADDVAGTRYLVLDAIEDEVERLRELINRNPPDWKFMTPARAKKQKQAA